MRQLEHQQKMENEKAEHQLRMELLSYQLSYHAAFRGNAVQSSPVERVQSSPV